MSSYGYLLPACRQAFASRELGAVEDVSVTLRLMSRMLLLVLEHLTFVRCWYFISG